MKFELTCIPQKPTRTVMANVIGRETVAQIAMIHTHETQMNKACMPMIQLTSSSLMEQLSFKQMYVDHCTLLIVMSTCIWLLRQQKGDIHWSLLAPQIRHPLLSIQPLKENIGFLDVKGQTQSRLTDHVLNVQEHFWSSHQLAEFNGGNESICVSCSASKT